ncbi:hypothetical protein Kisp01_19390 [Kineosporia sp. NBRC 101677]|uniref:hypothetical protein n=1 Tax=Kineosporia sp. NBRC 101677 TaxID=3032197 RepID=UPI0024A1023A|nr:hypothetical protein [Kineosporia sp. NBRC 101677]GLY14924.1 hypothetical protein Kisp01_19390 [Kineosporia sp. NBRC 101677]
MNDRQVEDLMRRARPVSSPSRFHDAGQRLLEEIMSSPAEETLETDVTPIPLRRNPTHRTRWLVAAAAVVAVAAAVPILLFQKQDPAAPAAPLPQERLEVDGNPHLFLKDPQWQPTSLYQGAVTDGSQTFVQGDRTTTISWVPIRVRDQVLAARTSEMRPAQPLTVFGQEATVLEDALNQEAFIPAGDMLVTVKVHGIRERKDFLSVLSQLQVLPPDQWEAALGDRFVNADRSAATAREMLADITLPPGFDLASLTSGLTQDRHQFGSNVLVTVSCAWLDRYEQARAQDDEKTMAGVDRALDGNREWALLQEIDDQAPDIALQVTQAANSVAAREGVSESTTALGCGDRD